MVVRESHFVVPKKKRTKDTFSLLLYFIFFNELNDSFPIFLDFVNFICKTCSKIPVDLVGYSCHFYFNLYPII